MKIPRPAVLVLALAAACARHEGDAAGAGTGSPPLFETRSEYATASQKHSDYFCEDLDGDGNLDMAIISLSGELRVLHGNGTDFAVTQQTALPDGPIWIAGGDFDEDGDLDLVIVHNASQIADTWKNDGTGRFTRDQELPLPILWALAVVTGDLDRDGHLDIVITVPESPQFKIFYGDGQGHFGRTQQMALQGGGQPFTVTVGDVTRDGRADLVASDNLQSRLVIYEGTPVGGDFGDIAYQLLIPGFPIATSLGDLSGDGLPDMCVSAFLANRYVVVTDILPPGVGTVTLDGGDGVPFLETRDYLSFTVNVPDKPSLSTIADVTGDGRDDLIACLAFRDSVFVAPQLPGGGVSDDDVTKRFYDAHGTPLRPCVTDLDRNGRNDLLVLAGAGDRVNVWRSNEQGRLLGARNFDSALLGSSWMVGGDFDGDGNGEIIVGSDVETRFSILRSGATASLAELVVADTFDTGAPIRQLEVADLDLDGRLDLIASTVGGVKVMRNMSSPGAFGFAVPLGTPPVLGSAANPFGATAADFDRDGNMDIAVCDFGGGLRILRGTGQPFSFLPEIVIQLGSKPMDVVAADFTGDGRLDLAVSREDAADIVLLRNVTPNGGLGPTEPGFEQFLTVPVGQSPNYLITADFNMDDRADLVVSNGDSGSVTVLFGSDNGFTGQDYAAGSVPTALMAQDLTGDGVPDILVASLVSGDFRVMVGDGTGGFPLQPSFPGTSGASNAVLQDMTDDGLPDLLISSLVTQRVSLVRNIRQD